MRRVRISNYQSIRSAEVELHPRVNVLLGPSDSGKSAFVRALRDCAFNATGTGMIRVGTKKASVEIDGVTWEKGKSVNRYTVNGATYDKVGRSAPEEVAEALGIREVAFGAGIVRRLQFASQFDPHFLLAENPADNAKVIGSLADLHVAFSAIREGDRRLRAENADAEDARKRGAELAAALAGVAEELQTAQDAQKQAEDAFTGFRGTSARHAVLAGVAAEYGRLVADLGALRARAVPLEPLRRCFEAAQRLGELLGWRARFTEALRARDAARDGLRAPERVERHRALVAAAEQYPHLAGLRARLDGARREVEAATVACLSAERLARHHAVGHAAERIATLCGTREQLATAKADLEADRRNLGRIKDARIKIIVELDAVEICPLCQQPTHGLGETLVD